MKSHRTATHLDYAFIVRLLIDGDKEGVLVRSLLRSDEEAYPPSLIFRKETTLSQQKVSQGFLWMVKNVPFVSLIPLSITLNSNAVRRNGLHPRCHPSFFLSQNNLHNGLHQKKPPSKRWLFIFNYPV